MKTEKRTFLITGAAGFLGSHLVEHLLKNTADDMILVDNLNYSGTLDRLRDIKIKGNAGNDQIGVDFIYTPLETPRVKFFNWDFRLAAEPNFVAELQEVTHIIHAGGMTHVDSSITDPMSFVVGNVVGTTNVLELARKLPNLEIVHYCNCYDETTRALTKDGLKTFSELKVGDIVFSVNPDTKKLEEKPISKIFIQDYTGPMINFAGKRNDLLVTPNHRMYYKSNQGSDRVKVSPASEMYQTAGYRQISGKWSGPSTIPEELKSIPFIDANSPDDIKNFLYVCGAFLGDGFTAYQERQLANISGYSREEGLKARRCPTTGRMLSSNQVTKGAQQYSVSKSYRIFFDIPKADPCRNKLTAALSNLGVNWSYQKGKAGEHIYFGSEEWLNFFDNTFGKGAYNKQIPSWMKSLSSEYLFYLFDGLIDTDGYHDKNTGKVMSYATVSDKLSSDVVELGLKLGFHPRRSRQHSENIYHGRTIKGSIWVVRFAKGAPRFFPKHNKEVSYTGKIWCVTVPDNKNLVVERNGVFSVSGNTDEVFGAAPPMHGESYEKDYGDGKIVERTPLFLGYHEDARHKPGNPYSASKSAAFQMVQAYANTYELPAISTNLMNLIGERQHHEKYIPKVLRSIIKGDMVHIHANAEKTKAGQRTYIHARNAAAAFLFLYNKQPWLGKSVRTVETYNICGEKELDNLQVAKLIEKFLHAEFAMGEPKLKYELVDFHSSRPGHDLRYALDGSKMKQLGWTPPASLEASLKKTVQWYLANRRWLNLEGN